MISQDETISVIDTTGGTTKVREFLSGKQLHELEDSEKTDATINAVLSPNGKLIASTGTDKYVRIWDSASGSLLTTLKGHGDLIADYSFHPTKDLLVTTSLDSKLRIWDVKSGVCKKVLTTLKNNMYSIEFSNDGEFMASGGSQGNVILWNTEDFAQLHEFTAVRLKVEQC